MSETRICANCGAEHSIEDTYQVEGDWLCEDCADHLTVICDHCAERFYEEHAVEDDTHTLCEHCFDEYYVRCEDCNRIIHRDRTYWDNDDNAYCASCWDEHCNIIHEYSYTPDLVFHGKGLRHFGVELEIDEGDTVNSNAQKLLDIANKDAENLYIKTDGSLDEGLELVTHPMTLEYQLNEMPWAEVLRKAQSMGYLSHAAGTCGLHVHISRLAFGCTYEQQEAAIARLLYFVEKFWAELLRFSRHTQSQMNRWAARYGIRLTPSEQMSHAEDSLRWTLYGSQSHERGYGRNPHVPRYIEAEYSQSHLASVLIANHTDVVTVSRQLGHSNVTTTETYYAHLIEESRVRAGECIADVMLRDYDGKGEKLSS